MLSVPTNHDAPIQESTRFGRVGTIRGRKAGRHRWVAIRAKRQGAPFFLQVFTLLFFSLTRKSKELNNFLQEIEEKIKEADKAFPDTVQ